MPVERSTHEIIEIAKDAAIAFWACMDGVSDTPLETLFTDTGMLVIVTSDTLTISGRDALADFARQRQDTAARNKRVTRHIVSNLRVVEQGRTSVTVHGYVTDYVGTGETPLPLTAPAAVADFSYKLVATDDGAWRLSLVSGTIVFAKA